MPLIRLSEKEVVLLETLSDEILHEVRNFLPDAIYYIRQLETISKTTCDKEQINNTTSKIRQSFEKLEEKIKTIEEKINEKNKSISTRTGSRET